MATEKRFTNATGAPVADNTNIMTAGPRGPALLQGLGRLRHLHGDTRHHALHAGEDLQRNR